MGYIYTIAKHAALARYRVSRRRGEGEGLDIESLQIMDPKGLDFVWDIFAGEFNRTLAEILESNALSAQTREVFRRRLIDGASYEDISKESGLRPAALHSMLYRAVKVLRQELERRGYRLR